MLDTMIRIGLLGAAILCGLVLLYLLAALGLLVCLVTFAAVSNLLLELRARRKMRLCGRFLPWRQALELIEDEHGTLIVESPTVGWAISRLWWTPDDVLARAPIPAPEGSERVPDALPRLHFIEWCHEHYTDLDGGTARLIAVYNGHPGF